VVEAVIRVGRQAMKNAVMVAIAVTLVAFFAYNVPFAVVVLLALLVGFVWTKNNPQIFSPEQKPAEPEGISVIEEAFESRSVPRFDGAEASGYSQSCDLVRDAHAVRWRQARSGSLAPTGSPLTGQQGR
jgi:hypothetical protein